MRSTQQMRDLWAPPGDSHNTLRFVFWNGVYVRMDRRMLTALTALDRILHRYRYEPKQPETWGYNNRAITGGSRPSLHAFGIAVDINSRSNPYGSKLVSDMPRAMVEEIEAIRTVSGQRVWRWGGDWNDNNKADDDSHDAMHFECQASPAELATGILVPTGIDPEPPSEEENDMLFIQVPGTAPTDPTYLVGSKVFKVIDTESWAALKKKYGDPVPQSKAQLAEYEAKCA